VGELLDRITSTELVAWQVYERDYGPLGPERLDHLAALVATVIAQANRGKRGRPWKVSDFLPQWGRRQRRKQTPQEQLEVIRSMVRAMGGKEVTAGGDDR